ncbi:MAG: DUF2214 domain-containing protein [Acidimicrobiia bacterium]|nr:DUF2214 domain-containing protein [Acidimicrobiia bacterium]
MHDVLAWMEASTLGHMMRESGPWTYAIVNLTHILGIASLFGAILVMDLRLLGCFRHVPLGSLAAATAPVGGAGLAIALTSGTALITANATEYAGNPFLLIKFPAIVFGLLNIALLMRSRAWRARSARELTGAERRQLAVMGGISLCSWLTAVAAGRMIGYW